MWFFKKILNNEVSENNSNKIDIESTKKEIGDILKRARETFEISLDELSKATSVKEKYLEELENGNLSSGTLALKDIETIIEKYPLSHNQKKYILTGVDNIMSSIGSKHTDERIDLKEIVQDLEK